ncbi:small integral membrane protein 8 [Megachile rotundata]|uniref:small integral membrane protein 8 n=1 Tax=Megachile rotundata TaxID=143995 RepID=UPI000614E488|nr:PREDICTED: small integral membrane protein 8 [Megachile rotundata]XP_012141890.1 PREDICTED: small integral membrane protein 8 [Megachile rotundata]XP_012141899.1 PREDICTED: small integral membrane protein 8 [Megachile rotundata]XP_012141906.1 PREDICTED: small integral membrane protein 8 [Megachile rotundata]XP_012141915.1 PREDICTED: small integral membrane protein 8 [Megachile rotundata]
MTEKKNKPEPGDGLRSLKSTTLFRAINYELYVKPNKVIMILGAITMFGCIGYITYMRQNYNDSEYYHAVAADETVYSKKKTSKWIT